MSPGEIPVTPSTDLDMLLKGASDGSVFHIAAGYYNIILSFFFLVILFYCVFSFILFIFILFV